MSCGNGFKNGDGPSSIESFYDLQNLAPKNPLDLLAMAEFNGTTGTPANSTTYSSETWTDVGSLLVISAEPAVSALGTDNIQNVADAAQWNLAHLTALNSSTVPIPLRRTIFLRAGTTWRNRITLTNSATIQDPQLSFLNNAATRGDMQGTVPVIGWTGSYTAGTLTLDVVLRQAEKVRMGFWFVSGGAYYMFDMQWFIVP